MVNNTEKKFRDNQKKFGHITKPLDLVSWLKSVYNPGSLKQIRYKKIAKSFLCDNLKQKIVLEVGAGVGDFTVFCSSLFPENIYFANDLSKHLLAGNIDEVLKYFKVDKRPELSFGPVEKLNYPDNKFDVVFAKAAVHHFEDPTAGLSEIYRVLEPGGKLVFFEDPICLDIPLYRDYIKRYFCRTEKNMGINENIYTISEYLNFGNKFLDKNFYLDEGLVKEFDEQQKKRSGFLKILGYFIRKNPTFFKAYMIKRFTSPLIFVFKKK